MGNSPIVTGCIYVASIGLAPVTGGVSLLGLIPTAGRLIEAKIADSDRHKTSVNIDPAINSIKNEKVSSLEYRYCHLSNKYADFGMTLAHRISFMGSNAAHHHFILLYTYNGNIIYIDKHGRRNILKRTNTQGMNMKAEWVNSAIEKNCSVSNKNVQDFIEFAKRDEFSIYHLSNSNCQHFAEAIYNFAR
jgi:hypothetical protein